MSTKVNVIEITVNGVKFEKFSSFEKRATFATNTETQETLILTSNGYCSNLNTIKRKIKDVFFK